MCLRVALYHTCNHRLGWAWRPCDHPLRSSLALPKPGQPHKFIPCGEGINAGLIAFKSPWSEYRADGKVCPYCEFMMRRERLLRREEKRASKERARREKYLSLWYSLQREIRAAKRPTQNWRMLGLMHMRSTGDHEAAIPYVKNRRLRST